ncbi:MAG: CoB--CoM heterodisulfide reductase iron-sulfur subunit A family protein, partial [Bacteroidetes bacterium]|nr:CoB--CoM heterodisulfide reductase iron-sulfur subunit A family protein [Bacteroidota bacterium]
MEEKRIGVYICWCGTNISLMVDVEKIAEEISELSDVVVSKNYKYMCSDPGQDIIINDIKEQKLNRIVVAACSPRMHEPTFRKALEKAGLNPYFFEMANIREQDSWVHTERDSATKKAKSLIIAAINKVKYNESLDKRSVDINPATLIIGGGIAGLTAAAEIAKAGKDVFIIEKTKRLGGALADIDQTFPFMYSAGDILTPKINYLKKCPKVKIFRESKVKEINGYIGNFETTVFHENNTKTELKFGNIIVATGLKTFNPEKVEEYGYGLYPDVMTSMEFEKLLQNGGIHTKEGKTPKYVSIIHCVGSRNKNYHEYCSRTCCLTALKFANLIKSELPDTDVFELYSDIRSFGKGSEELYTESSRKDIVFLMFDNHKDLPKVKKAGPGDDCNLLIEMDDMISGKQLEVPADIVILMTGAEAHEDAKEISHAVNISLCNNSFFIEKHPKLDPVATTTDGVYIVGTCQGPKDIPDSVAQAKAASARILATIAKG